jgi:hypothetical protein
MNKTVLSLAFTLMLGACAWFQQDPDAGEPAVDKTTSRSVQEVVDCLTVEAGRHDASVHSTPLPQGTMLDFGDSNVVKVRTDNGATTYRFYAGKRRTSNLWIEGASKTCAP